jgi:ssDNA-specific exonuclease RecJ
MKACCVHDMENQIMKRLEQKRRYYDFQADLKLYAEKVLGRKLTKEQFEAIYMIAYEETHAMSGGADTFDLFKRLIAMIKQVEGVKS